MSVKVAAIGGGYREFGSFVEAANVLGIKRTKMHEIVKDPVFLTTVRWWRSNGETGKWRIDLTSLPEYMERSSPIYQEAVREYGELKVIGGGT